MTILSKHQKRAFDDAENASAVGENDQDHVVDNDFDDHAAAAADYDDYSADVEYDDYAAADYADYSADVEYVADQLHLGPGSEHLDSASHYCSKRL